MSYNKKLLKQMIEESKQKKPQPKPKDKLVKPIVNSMGQWAHPGEITVIPGNSMATHGYGNIPLYVEANNGFKGVIPPNVGNVRFPGATQFTEYPLVKAQKGLSVEQRVNKSLGEPMKKAHQFADQIQPDQDEDFDNARHYMAGALTNKAIQNKFSPLLKYTGIPQVAGFLGSNILGLAHELSTLYGGRNKDPRPWTTRIRESFEDVVNNAIGATAGTIYNDPKKIQNLYFYLSKKNLLPDGIEDPNGLNLYLKKTKADKGRFGKYRNGGDISIPELPKAQVGKNVPSSTYVKKPIVQIPIGPANDPDVIKYFNLKKDETWGSPYEFMMNWYSNPTTKAKLKSQGFTGNPMKEALNQKLFKDYLDWQIYKKNQNRKDAETIYPDDYENKRNLQKILDEYIESVYEDKYKRTGGFHNSDDSTVAINKRWDIDDDERQRTAVHELTHATPLDNYYTNYFKTKKPKNPKAKEKEYFDKDPVEIYPRIMDLRFQMNLKPGRRVTPDMLEDYYNDSDYDLKNYYSPKELADIMNEIAYNSKQNLTSAKIGGSIPNLEEGNWLNRYQRGGATTKTTKNRKDERNLESGTIVDKGSNTMYVVQNGKVVKSFPVLTGKAGANFNTDPNSNNYPIEVLEKNPNLRSTPTGTYLMNPATNIYGWPGYDLTGIPAFGVSAPNAYATAMHITYGANPKPNSGLEGHPDPNEYKRRNAAYNKSFNQRYMSYGCTNMQGEAIDCLTQTFPQGDTAIYIDSRRKQDLNYINSVKNKVTPSTIPPSNNTNIQPIQSVIIPPKKTIKKQKSIKSKLKDGGEVNWLNRYEEGGSTTAETTRPPKVYTNYPEYIKAKKDHGDSLSAFNADKSWENYLKTVPDNKYTFQELNKLYDKHLSTFNKNPKLWELRVLDKSGVVKDDYTRKVITKDGDYTIYYSPVFKKPVQPVILQQESPQIKMVGQDRVQSITPSFNINRPARVSTIDRPKGNYAVDYFDENLQPQTNYFPTPEIADMFMKERMENKMYGPSMTRRGVYQDGGQNNDEITLVYQDGTKVRTTTSDPTYAKYYGKDGSKLKLNNDGSISIPYLPTFQTKNISTGDIKNNFNIKPNERILKEDKTKKSFVPVKKEAKIEKKPIVISNDDKSSFANNLAKYYAPQIELGRKIVSGVKQTQGAAETAAQVYNNLLLNNLNEAWELAKGIPSGLERFIEKYQTERPESITKTAEKIKNIQKQKQQVVDSLPIKLGYTQYDVIPDYGKDSLVSFSNVFDNDLGADYIIGNKVKEVTDADAPRVFKNARAVAHFLRDSDILPNQKIAPPSWTVSKGYTYNTTSPGKTVSAGHLNEMDWNRTLYKPIPGTDKWKVKYLKPGSTENLKDLEKQGWSTDFTVSMQHKFSDIDWDKEGPTTGYRTKSKWVPLKDGSHTYIPYRDKNAFSRFSGGSVTFLLKDPKTGKSIGADFAGSVNAIKEYGKHLIKTFNIKPDDLEVVYHDMGSYSAKPKAKPDGTLSYDQWINYNNYNRGFSGAPLIIPIKEDGGPIPAYARGPMFGDIQMRGNVNIPTQMAYDASQARKAQAAREATTIGADTRTATQKAKDAQYAAEINKRRKDLGFIEGTGHTQQAIERDRAKADRIIHNLVDVPLTVMGVGELAYLGSKGAAKALPELGEYLTTQTPLRNAYKINPFAIKENPEMFLYRARPIGQNVNMNMAAQLRAKQAAGEPLTWYQKNLLNPQTNPQMLAREKYYGQWFEKDPSRLDFYIDPGTRNFADNETIEILRTRLPKTEANKLNVSQFDDAKVLSASPETEFILPKNMINSAERFPESSWQQLIQEDKAFNTPHWLRGYKKVPKVGEYLKKGFLKNTSPSKANFFSGLASKQNVITPSGIPAVTNSEIETLIQREIDRLNSDEYILRRMATTGESIDKIRKSTQKWINEYKKKGIDKVFKFVNKLDDNALAVYTRNRNIFSPGGIPKIEYIPEDRINMLNSLDHEIKHWFSPTLRNEKLYKNYPTLKIAEPEKRTVFQKLFGTKPFTKDEKTLFYLGDEGEQQVRGVRLHQRILDDLNIPEYREITQKELDNWIDNYYNPNSKKYYKEGFHDVADLFLLAKKEAKGAPIKKDLLDWINKVWAIPTGAFGAKSLEQKKKGGQTNWLDKYN